MRLSAIVGLAVALVGGGLLAQAPESREEHAWLQQLAGEWEYETEACLEAGKPPVKINGTESVRMVGVWAIAEHKTTALGQQVTGILTVGFDRDQGKYVGTWLDSMNSRLLHYEGTLDPTAGALTLLTEAPDPATPGKRCKFKEVLEVKGKDEKLFTTSMQGKDGAWSVLMTIRYRRKK